MKKNYVAPVIYNLRRELGLTQDQFASKYGLSGPAIFKFERGYVIPSLETWMKMAKEAGLPEKFSVLLLLKSKLPNEYQEYVDLSSAVDEDSSRSHDYSKFKNREQILEAAQSDPGFPLGLRNMIEDDELWGLYSPTGDQLNWLADVFGRFGPGSKESYRQALCLAQSVK